VVKNITIADCEGSEEMFKVVKGMCLLARKLLQSCFGYFSLIPWYFSLADTVEGSRECIRQLDLRPLSEHDSETQDIVARVGADIRQRAAGGALTEALAFEVKVLKHSPLDESCGEGLHRDSTHEKTRAPPPTPLT